MIYSRLLATLKNNFEHNNYILIINSLKIIIIWEQSSYMWMM